MKDDFYKRLLDNASDLIWAIDMEGCFTYINDNIKDWGYDKEELIGKPLLGILNTKQIGKRYSETSKLGISSAFEMEVLDKNGEAHMVMVSTSPLHDENENVMGVMGIIHDISETQKLEQKLINEERLASLGRLSTGVAHEIRNPLSSVKMNLAILRKRLEPKGVDAEHFTIAQNEVENLERIVTELIDYAKPISLDLKRHNLNKVIENTISTSMAEANKNDISINFLRNGSLPLSLIDKGKIHQALLNIIFNAIQASHSGGEVRVSVLYDKNSRVVSIKVEDDGDGIDPENLRFIFDPFYTTKKTGVGMGLAQVKGIMKNHKGSVSIKHGSETGTEALLEFPVG